MKNIKTLGLLGATLFAVACSNPASDLPGDDEGASFGGEAGKSDWLFSKCEQSEVLKLVNESTSTPDHLNSLGVNKRAATNIWTHRLGPDAELGTADDDIFDDFSEFDDVSYVGPATLQQAVDAVASRCHESLNDRPFIDRNTFADSSGSSWARDNQEIEAAMTISGITGQRLNAVLRGTDSRDRTIFSRIRRNRDFEGLTYGYPIDEVPWDDDSMKVREALGYVSLSIESGRFEVDPEDDDGERELSVGTDIMDDTYYDVANFDLLNAEMTIRGRVRWDSDSSVRRMLIAAKFGSEVDADGLKRAAKVDIRTESGTHMATLDHDVMSGIVPWSSRPEPIRPINDVYRRALELDMLPDMQGRADVLLLNPKVHMRSERSRFHLNEAAIDALKTYYTNGRTRIEKVDTLIQSRLDTLPAADRADAEALLALGENILSGAEIESRVGAAIPTARPDEFVTPSELADLELQHTVADAVYEAMHDYAEQLDDLDNAIAGSNGLSTDDEFMKMFVTWRKSTSATMKRKTVAAPFLDEYETMSANLADSIAAFNTFGQTQLDAGNEDFEDFTPVNETMWEHIGAYLRDDDLGDSHRMIATAGIMARSLWFDRAREFYVPASSRSSYSNFIIDTMDFTQMVTREEWGAIPEGERTPATELDPAKVFHSMLVNEVQIELGSEEPYLNRIEELKTQLAANPDPNTEALLEGARWVFTEYRSSLTTLAAMKGDAIVDRIEDESGQNGLEWGPSIASKGETALQIVADGVGGPNP